MVDIDCLRNDEPEIERRLQPATGENSTCHQSEDAALMFVFQNLSLFIANA
jgi:hypothetical protein